MQEMFKQLVKNQVKPLFAKRGYAKKKMGFLKVQNNLLYSFNLQKSHGNSAGQVMFYVNCGIYSPELAQWWADPVALSASSSASLPSVSAVSDPYSVAPQFTARIEEVVPEAPARYSLTSDMEPEAIGKELTRHLAEAVDFLEGITDTRAILDYYRVRVALHLSEENLRYLLHHKERETADQYMQQLQAKYGAEQRWAIWDAKFCAIYAEQV